MPDEQPPRVYVLRGPAGDVQTTTDTVQAKALQAAGYVLTK